MTNTNDLNATVVVTANDMEVMPGETVPRDISIYEDTQKVRMLNVSKNDKTGKNYKVDWTFDFSDCTQKDLLMLAARSAVIAYRKNFRNVSSDAISKFATRTINVKDDILTTERSTKSNGEKAADLMGKMSTEEIVAALAAAGISADQLK